MNRFRLSWTLALSVGWLGMVRVWAGPMMGNLVAVQRPGTQLVDLTYDLRTSDVYPVKIAVAISVDGGVNFTAPATALMGAVGNGVLAGTQRQIVWNAAADVPGQLLTRTVFKLTATELVPTDAELDVDTREFITRATASGDAVSAGARRGLDNFVRESKRLGFWSRMVMVPCRSGYGALNPLGGSLRRTNTKFARKGTTLLTADGLKFVPGPNYASRVQTPFSWNLTEEPAFVGVLGYADTGPGISPRESFLRSGNTNPVNLLGTYNCGEIGYPVMMGFSTPGSSGAEFLLCNGQCTSVRRPNFGGAQFDGSHTLKGVHNQLYQEITAGTATTGHPAGPVSFFQPTGSAQTHVIQACVLLYGDVSGASLKSFWPLVASTYLADAPAKYVYLCVGGQSNASIQVAVDLSFRDWQATTAPLFQYTGFRYGGQYLSYWIGSDPNQPQRQTGYQDAKQVWLNDKPTVKDATWDPLYLWFQGESDTEQPQTSLYYRTQLQIFTSLLRQDLRPDLMMGVVQIDYAVQYRTFPEIGNFTLSGCGGTASPANGMYGIKAMTGLANALTNYEWSFGEFQLTRDGGAAHDHWRIHALGVTYFVANEDEPHPAVIPTWMAQNGASGVPIIGTSRTGRIEQVRKAQRDFVAQDVRAFTVDSRGLERGMDAGNGDPVHLSVAAYAPLADRVSQAFNALKLKENAAFTATSATIPIDSGTPFNLWIQSLGLPPQQTGKLSVPQNDGVTNLVKYALNLDPTKPDVHAMNLTGNGGLPYAYAQLGSGGTALRLVVVRRKNDAALKYEAEFTTNLAQWTSTSTPILVQAIDAVWERATFASPVDQRTRLGRMRITYGTP